ncbi:MAG: class I SAM-dependent methyltransferase [Myxococcota bacterium]
MLFGLTIASVGIVSVAIILLLGYYVRTGAPPVPAKPSEVADVVALLKEAGLSDGACVYELGCGWGTLAVAVARAFPKTRVIGVEMSPIPHAVAATRARRIPNLEVRRADFHRISLKDADAVTCYLMIAPMDRLARTLDRELRNGTPVVALTFWFRGRVPVARRRGPGVRGDVALYYWPAYKEAA